METKIKSLKDFKNFQNEGYLYGDYELDKSDIY